MFSTETYVARRARLKEQVGSGLLLFLGNNESPVNFPDNWYPHRQDSNFLYFWGLNSPGLAATIDLESGTETIYGDDLTVDQIVWMGSHPLLKERAVAAGVTDTKPFNALEETIKTAKDAGRTIQFLPQYRHDNMMFLSDLLGLAPGHVNDAVTLGFVKAVIAQRSIKSDEELREIEVALEVTYDMHTYAMKQAKPGMTERDIAGAMQGIAVAGGGNLAYPVIFTVDGQTLHNHYYGNTMKAGDIAVNDSGAEAASGYASDITRTIPIGGKFIGRQRDIYQIVLDSMESGIEKCRPGVPFKEVHLHCARLLVDGLTQLGVMRGDSEEAVQAGAHAMFFQCGTGHMMGLDVHDMEDLGEELVGYDANVQRSSQFGLCYLRLGKPLQPGYVVTVEPGIYVIPELIDMWKGEKKLAEFINYDELEKWRDFGGVRVEENVVITQDGYRILGKPIPKTMDDVEALASI